MVTYCKQRGEGKGTRKQTYCGYVLVSGEIRTAFPAWRDDEKSSFAWTPA